MNVSKETRGLWRAAMARAMHSAIDEYAPKDELNQLFDTVDALEAAVRRLQTWANDAWARGHAAGMRASDAAVRQAVEALRIEREAHAFTQARLSEALEPATPAVTATLPNGVRVTGAAGDIDWLVAALSGSKP